MAENQNAADQASTLNDARATRLAKRAALFEAGQNPYPEHSELEDYVADSEAKYAELADGEDTEDVVKIAGRVVAKRGQGKIMFIVVRDATAESQLFCRINDMDEAARSTLKALDLGDILGVAGVAGSGQRELLESIAGLYPIASGSVTYYAPDGAAPQELAGKDPMDIRKAGIAMSFVPEDRLGMGLVGSMGMTGNMMLRSWRKGHSIFLDRKNPEALAQRIWQELEVVTPSTSFPVRRMTGGKVQKVQVGREIAQEPSVLMTAYAVRGLDINTSYTIYNLLTEQKMKGVAVVYVGEDLDVLLELCDRIVVLCGGQVSGVVDGRTTNKMEVGALMTRAGGGKADE